MMEIGRVAREPLPMRRVMRIGPAPEIGRVGHVRQRTFEHGDAFLAWANDERGPACARRVFQGVAGAPLRRVHTDAQGVIRHVRANEAEACLQGLGACFARELPIGCLRGGYGANRLRHNRGRRFDGVWMRFAAHPDRANEPRVNRGARQGVARGFDGHRGRVFIQAGHGLFFDRHAAFAIRPHA